jgi:iron complex outermembrane receptor protein
VGYAFSNRFKVYGNIGYTYRIPTYTDLYYSDPVTSGNEDLEPEEAFAQELGVKYTANHFLASFAVFNRDAKNLIDYIRSDASEDLFTATNITEVNTMGLEADASYYFKVKEFDQNLSVGYAYLEDDIQQDPELSRYRLNTLKHHFTTRVSTQFFKNIRQNIIYKYAERSTGQTYNVWDASIALSLGQAELSLTANNIFDADYIESGFVPMPPSNVLFGFRYHFK